MSNDFGRALYFASDKTIFDSLNQPRVTEKTLRELFGARHTIISKDTPREDLAGYFSVLTHDLLDHDRIAGKLGIAQRRERIASMDVSGTFKSAQVFSAMEKIQKYVQDRNDYMKVTRDGDRVHALVSYTYLDYTRPELQQAQQRDGVIEFVPSANGFVIRSTLAPHMDELREKLLKELSDIKGVGTVQRSEISLPDPKDHKARLDFFMAIARGLQGMGFREVKALYVNRSEEDIDEEDDSTGVDPRIRRITWAGRGVPLSDEFKSAHDSGNYCVSRIIWTVDELFGSGFRYEIEAQFSMPFEARGFSYMVKGVYPRDETGALVAKQRVPQLDEAEKLASLIEEAARKTAIAVTPIKVASKKGGRKKGL
jgi:hypothetical protein